MSYHRFIYISIGGKEDESEGHIDWAIGIILLFGILLTLKLKTISKATSDKLYS